MQRWSMLGGVFLGVIAGIILGTATFTRAQEATTTPETTTTTPIEGIDVLPDGAPIVPEATGSSTQEIEAALNVVQLPTFEDRIAEITNPDVLQLVKQKRDVDDLASKYAKLYDSCRFGR